MRRRSVYLGSAQASSHIYDENQTQKSLKLGLVPLNGANTTRKLPPKIRGRGNIMASSSQRKDRYHAQIQRIQSNNLSFDFGTLQSAWNASSNSRRGSRNSRHSRQSVKSMKSSDFGSTGKSNVTGKFNNFNQAAKAHTLKR